MTTWTKHDNPCIEKAAEDEPLFVLRAQDAFAPALVRKWADRYRNRHAELVGSMDSQYAPAWSWPDEEKKRKYENALRLADAMENWPTRKEPD